MRCSASWVTFVPYRLIDVVLHGDRTLLDWTEHWWMPCFRIVFLDFTPSRVTQLWRLASLAWFHRIRCGETPSGAFSAGVLPAKHGHTLLNGRWISKRSSSLGCIASCSWLTVRAEAAGLLCFVHSESLPDSRRGGGVFQLHSGYGLSLGVPSPSLLLRLGRLDGCWDVVLGPVGCQRPPVLWDGCRIYGLVEKLLQERIRLGVQLTTESRMDFVWAGSL